MTIERFITLLMATFWYAIGYLWTITFSDLNWLHIISIAMFSLSIIGFLLTFYRR